MPTFVVQGKSKDADLIARGVESLGGRVIRSLSNLERLSGAAVLIVEVPEPLTHKELEALPGVRIVEGEFFHPFYSCGGQHPPEVPQPAQFPFYLPFVTPSDAVASLLQLLPPQVYKAAVPQPLLEAITAMPTAESGALQKFDVREMPFGAPGLRLGTPATAEQFRRAGDLARILETIRAPQAQRLTLGENAVIAIIDSGIDPSKVPGANRLGGWSDTGADPWVDDTGHGSMVAEIALAVAPKAQIISIKPGVSPTGAMSSMGTLSALDHLAGLAQELRTPIISNHSWGIFGVKNMQLPCSILHTRAVRLLDEEGLVITSWAAGNNGAFGQFPNLYCMNSTKWSVSTGALDRLLRPHFYTSRGFGQCYPFQPTVSTVTYGILPWGAGYMDFGEQGAGTSSCAPQTSGALALMLSFYGPKPFRDLRAALRAGANNAILGFPGLPYHPATGAGLLQVDAALAAVPRASSHPSWLAEATIPTSIPRLGEEPEMAA